MRLSNFIPVAAVVLAASSSVHAAGTFYTTEAQFQAAIGANRYVEDFGSFTFGSPLNGQASYVAPGANGFGWTATAPGGLYSNASALSTNNNSAVLTITFTGSSVTAFGGFFSDTDFSGNNTPGTVTINTSDGGSKVLTNPTSTTFTGYTSATPITSVTLSPVTANASPYVQIDHFYTGVTGGGNEPWRVADINSDNKVSVGDLGILATNFGKSTTAGKSFGDLNADNIVSVGDLGILATYFGQPTAASVQSFDEALSKFPELQAAAVPEPSVALAAMLLTSLAPRRRR